MLKNIFFVKMNSKAQVILEFIFCMIIVFLMIYALVRIFVWSGVETIRQRVVHENYLVVSVNENYNYFTPNSGPLHQLKPNFYTPATTFNAIWKP